MSEWKNGKAVVYEDRHGNTRCGACYVPLWCNDCGDMPETCPQCGAPLDYSIYDEPSAETKIVDPHELGRLKRCSMGSKTENLVLGNIFNDNLIFRNNPTR